MWWLSPSCSLFEKYPTLAFPKLSDFVVYPLHLLGFKREEDKRWAVMGVGVAALCSIGAYRKDGVRLKINLSPLFWSQMSVLG